MVTRDMQITRLVVGTLKLEIHPNSKAAGEAAARAAAEAMQKLAKHGSSMGIIFATGASQLGTLHALTSIQDLPWNKVQGFHLDEYIGIPADHPASFRRYLRENLTGKVRMKDFVEIDGTAADPARICRDYAEEIRSADPQLCLLGIGENGHLAFNDPAEADFHDPQAMKVVTLDRQCREQQAAEGWFPSWEEVPQHALTLTIPTLFRVPKLIVSVPGKRKTEAVRRTLYDPITTRWPSTLLRTHPDVTIYLDTDSAAELKGVSLRS